MHERRQLSGFPPLRWIRSKAHQLWVVRHLYNKRPPTRWVEPFCGGISIALGLAPERALLNDKNPHLINFYRQLQAGGFEYTQRYENVRRDYHYARKAFNKNRHTLDRLNAELFFYLNRCGFHGLWRTNKAGEYNVPFGHHRWVDVHADLSHQTERIAGWEFTSGDFTEVVVQDGDMLYVDPPPDGCYEAYNGAQFQWTDHERLVLWLNTLPCPVIATNRPTDRVLELYQDFGFRIHRVKGKAPLKQPKPIEMLATRGFD